MQLRWLVEKVIQNRWDARWNETEDYIAYTDPRLQYSHCRAGAILWKDVPVVEVTIDNRKQITPIKDITANST